mmetsp:Transcript_117994/g.216202  ORF Transcript_117994/g.216202 Transcript_117994/m.216202 type:complete len:209 (+) Transcript_117994:1908-2534(+)
MHHPLRHLHPWKREQRRARQKRDCGCAWDALRRGHGRGRSQAWGTAVDGTGRGWHRAVDATKFGKARRGWHRARRGWHRRARPLPLDASDKVWRGWHRRARPLPLKNPHGHTLRDLRQLRGVWQLRGTAALSASPHCACSAVGVGAGVLIGTRAGAIVFPRSTIGAAGDPVPISIGAVGVPWQAGPHSLNVGSQPSHHCSQLRRHLRR